LRIPFKTGIFILFLTVIIISDCAKTSGQCPSIIYSDFNSSCSNSGSPCNLCTNQTITLGAVGSNLPNGGCIKWYYSQIPGFNPYNGQGTFINCGTIFGNVATDVSFETIEDMCNAGTYYIVGILDPINLTSCPEIFTTQFSFNVFCPEATISATNPAYEYHDLNLNSSGGSAYNWSGPNGFTSNEQNPIIYNLDPNKNSGTYTVTVTDDYGCKAIKTIEVKVLPWILVIIEPSPLLTTEICNGDSITLKAIILGAASGNYLNEGWYTWMPLGQGSFITKDTNLVVNAGGGYVYWVKDTLTGVKVGFFKWVYQLLPLDIKIVSSTTQLCTGGTATLTANSNNGTPGYDYLWNTGAVTPSIEINEPGSYDITITDAKACKGIKSITIKPGTSPIVNISPSSSIFCPNESKTIIAQGTGGKSPYIFNWAYPGGTSMGSTLQASITGIYQVTITDEIGCIGTTSALMTQNPDISIAISQDVKIDCKNGSIELTANTTGGSGTNYQYSWSTPSGSATGPTITTFETGLHTVTVTDSENCKKETSIFVQIALGLVVDINPTTAEICSGGKVDLTAQASGGDGNYSYEWSSPIGTLNQEIITANTVGYYYITVTDSGGCSGQATIEVKHKADMLVLIIPDTVSFCKGDSAILSASSIEPGILNFKWSTPNGIQNIDTIIANKAGIYTVTLTNSYGCTGNASINVYEDQLPDLSISPDIANFCPGSSVQLNASSINTNIISCSWISPDGLHVGNNILAGIEGNYVATITNTKGCSTSDSIFVNKSPDLNVSIFPLNPGICNNKSIDITANATGSNLIFEWNTPNGKESGKTIKAIKPGAYTVTVFDEGGCSASAVVVVDKLPGLDIVINPDPASFCNKGSVTLNAISSTGISPYSYQWKTPNIDATNMSIIANTIGNYSVTVTDVNGCIGTKSTQVSQDSSLNISFLPALPGFCPNNSEVLSVNTKGGKEPYKYSWNCPLGTFNTSSIKISSAGTYQVTVTDSKGCTGTSTTSTFDKSLSVELDKTDPECISLNSGSISLLSAVNANFPLQLSVNKTQPLFINSLPYVLNTLSAGTYDLDILGSNGCKVAETIDLSSAQIPSLELGEDVTIFYGEAYTINPKSNFTIDSMEWTNKNSLQCSPGCFEPVASPKISTNYKAIAYNQEGCKAKDDINIYIVEKESVFIPNTFSPNGDGFNDKWVIFTDQTVKQIKKLFIYDRWGESIFLQENFTPNDSSNGWDGKYKAKPLNSGVYIYYVLIEFEDGRVKEFKGDINLMP